MKQVALLTDFAQPDSSYSLCIVAEEQLRMLLDHGYQPVAVVEQGFQPDRVWGEVELRYLPPGEMKNNRYHFPDGWQAETRRLYEGLGPALEGVEIVITHDLIYQNSQLFHNLAARQYARENSEVKWLHWIHSATASPIYQKNEHGLGEHFPNSLIVFPNEYSRRRVAINFRCEVDQVVHVPHSTDLVNFLGFHPLTKQLIREYDLLSPEALFVYPARLDRGKQVEFVIRTAAEYKRLGRSVACVVVDFHSASDDPKDDKYRYRQELQQLAVDRGLDEFELLFTSQVHPDLKVSAPREVVRDLMLLCNVYMHPSVSETYSLTTQEAGLCGAFLVLNFDFPPMRQIYGEKAAYYKFSSAMDAMQNLDGSTTTEYGNVDDYCHDIALRVAYELEHNHVLAQRTRIRRERNPAYVFKKYLEPLFARWDG